MICHFKTIEAKSIKKAIYLIFRYSLCNLINNFIPDYFQTIVSLNKTN
jgi:hypothetical protein